MSFAILLVSLLTTPERTADGPRIGTVYIVEVTVPDAAHRAELVAAGYDVSNVRGNVVTIYAAPDEVRALEATGWPIRQVGVQPAPPEYDVLTKALGVYHNYATLTDALNAYAAGHPAICRLSSLGESVQGRDIWAMLITNNPDVEEDEPEFKYVATMHGNEQLGTEMCLYLIDHLLTNYGQDSRITSLVDTTAIWIVPLMNPDGLELGRRENAHGYDLNRSFPEYPEDFTGTLYEGEPLGDAGREPEVAAIMRWTADNSFVLSANYHTGELVVNYPYDDDGKPSLVDSPTPDDLLFEEISRLYALNNPMMHQQSRFPDGITNGAVWYVIEGGMQDWNYRFVSCNEVTLEISTVWRPPQSALPTYWADNAEAMLAYLEAVHMGVRGVVVDGETGEPLWAKVTVEGNAHSVFTDPDVGDYHRMLLPGVYDLAFSAQGDYVPQTVRDVEVQEATATRVDVALLDPDIDNDGTVGATDVQLVINAILEYPVPYPCDLDGGGVTVTDLQKLIVIALNRQ